MRSCESFLPHHIGEELLANIIKSVLKEGSAPVRCVAGESVSDLRAVVTSIFGPKSDITYGINVRPASIQHDGRQIFFDGVHGIDVSIAALGRFIPVEVKLGLSRMDARSFEHDELALVRFSHAATRIAGPMSSILSGGLVKLIPDAVLQVEIGKFVFSAASAWLLIARRLVLAYWQNNGYPAWSVAPWIVTFEDLAESMGRDVFNRLVNDIVGSQDHFDSWIAGQPVTDNRESGFRIYLKNHATEPTRIGRSRNDVSQRLDVREASDASRNALSEIEVKLNFDVQVTWSEIDRCVDEAFKKINESGSENEMERNWPSVAARHYAVRTTNGEFMLECDHGMCTAQDVKSSIRLVDRLLNEADFKGITIASSQ